MRLGFRPVSLVATAIIFAADLLWFRCAIVDGWYGGYSALRNGPGVNVTKRTKLFAILAHAVIAGATRSMIICDTTAEAAGIGALIGFYTYCTFNITMCAMVPWDLKTWLPDIVYGTALWTIVSVIVYSV
jgi:uncharacterized membrane protein